MQDTGNRGDDARTVGADGGHGELGHGELLDGGGWLKQSPHPIQPGDRHRSQLTEFLHRQSGREAPCAGDGPAKGRGTVTPMGTNDGMHGGHGDLVAMTLDAVIVAISAGRPRLLVVDREGQRPALPSGPLDADEDATLELAMRRLIRTQTGLEVGYVEQLYTFGDRDRGATSREQRDISVAYLALVRETEPALDARWIDVYELLPWEDRRVGHEFEQGAQLQASLGTWAGRDAHRLDRIAMTFGPPWDGIRVLDRYELLYGAGLVAEGLAKPTDGTEDADTTGDAYPMGTTDPAGAANAGFGQPMALDHRRIAATALGRIRGKLTYRPVVFELLPETFRLLDLQRTVEALAGIELHKQNFRRLVERSGLVEGTGERTTGTAGRPAELFRYRPSVQLERPRPGVGVPYR